MRDDVALSIYRGQHEWCRLPVLLGWSLGGGQFDRGISQDGVSNIFCLAGLPT